MAPGLSEATQRAAKRTAGLACWSGEVDPEVLTGGLTNHNFVIRDRGETFVVRIAEDIPLHGIMRFNEVASSRAAHAAGVSPEIIHAEPGALVMRFIEGATCGEAEVRAALHAGRIVPLIKRVHREIPKHFEGPALIFWVFQSVRGYTKTLRDGGSRMTDELPRFLEINAALETALGPVEITFGHNDMLAANFIDDGTRLWLIDWDYGGFDCPLFDLANLASNNFFSPEEDDRLLEDYYETPATDELRRKLHAMKCASLLRESMWSMVSEIHLDIDVDYVAYTDGYLARFEAAYAEFRAG